MTSTSLLRDEPFTMHAIDDTIYSIKREKSLIQYKIFKNELTVLNLFQPLILQRTS